MTTSLVRRPLDLGTLHLAAGGHDDPGDTDVPGEMCLLEAVAFMAGEEWSDSPTCVCTVLAAFGRQLNDLLPDDRRQKLRQYMVPMLGTAGDGKAEARRWMAVDWTVRTATPMWLDAAEQAERAARLRGLPPIDSWAAYKLARPVMRQLQDDMWALRRAKLNEIRAADAAADAAAVAAADADAVAAAVAAAAAAAVAAADADAVAAAAAVAVAAAVAAAAAVAVAAAAADAAADAAAVAAAAADADWDSATYKRVYAETKARIEERFAPIIAAVQTSAIELFGRMIRPVPS